MLLSLAEGDLVTKFVGRLAQATLFGIPSELCKDRASDIIDLGRDFRALQPADDDAALEGLIRHLPKRVAK
jgi:hypothetical protein